MQRMAMQYRAGAERARVLASVDRDCGLWSPTAANRTVHFAAPYHALAHAATHSCMCFCAVFAHAFAHVLLAHVVPHERYWCLLVLVQ